MSDTILQAGKYPAGTVWITRQWIRNNSQQWLATIGGILTINILENTKIK
ncbi:MAG: hypothetical protein FWG10_07835 [Eubacteriaceae bacterium]|nr:hypothetical protein [Eubacteriaceae bacterium]